VQAADLAPELPSPTQLIELPGRTAALPLHTLVRTIEENKTPVSSGQTSSINGMRSQRFHTARSHRFLPLGAVLGDLSELVTDDDVAGFVNYRFSAINF